MSEDPLTRCQLSHLASARDEAYVHRGKSCCLKRKLAISSDHVSSMQSAVKLVEVAQHNDLEIDFIYEMGLLGG